MHDDNTDSQAILRRLIDQATFGVLILDPYWTVRFSNAAIGRMLGPEITRDCHLLDVLAKRYEFSPSEIETGTSRFTLRPQDTEDTARCFSVELSPPWDPGWVERMVAVVQTVDIPDERILNAEEYIALASHKLLTPLAAITASLSLLHKSDLLPSPEDRDTIIDEAEAAAEKLRRAIDRIISMAEALTGSLHPTPPTQVAEIVEIQAASARLSHPALRIETTIKVGESGFPLRPGELEAVLENLLDNARKYADKHESQIRITAFADGSRATLTVEDNGCGVEPSDQTRVFERFYGGGKQPPGVSGAGLGLALVKKIVTSRAGKVSLESIPGEGTAVRIEFLVNSNARTLATPHNV